MRDNADDISTASSLAEVAKAVYNPNVTKTENWRRVSQSELSALELSKAFSEVESSGVVAGLYKNTRGDYALSFAGTDFSKIKDIRTNLRQGLGFKTKQYKDSVDLAKAVRTEVKANLMITGHSKGGGQAIIAGAVTGARTVTFNPAGVHKKTFSREGLDKQAIHDLTLKTGQIQNYVAKGEVLDKINGLPVAPSTVGKRMDLKSDEIKTRLGSGHSINHIIKLLDERMADLTAGSAQRLKGAVTSLKDKIGHDILQSFNAVQYDNASISSLRETVTNGYQTIIDNSITDFEFYGANAPKELGAAAALDGGLTSELMMAQSAVDTINQVRPALNADEPNNISSQQMQNLKISSQNNVYGDAFLQASTRVSPAFRRAYTQTQTVVSLLVPGLNTAHRLSDMHIDTSLMNSFELKNTAQNLKDKISVIYKNPDKALKKATELASDPSISSSDLRKQIGKNPEILGELKHIKKGMFNRIDRKTTQRSVIDVKNGAKALSASLKDGRLSVREYEEGVSKTVSACAPLPSRELTEALGKFDKNPDLKNYGKGYDVEKLYTEGQKILEQTGIITKLSGKHGFGIKPDALENIKKLKSTVQRLQQKRLTLTKILGPKFGPKT